MNLDSASNLSLRNAGHSLTCWGGLCARQLFPATYRCAMEESQASPSPFASWTMKPLFPELCLEELIG